jgi:orotidine-5'-phosphate decarboxylase
MGFAARLAARIRQHSPLCIGIDPSASLLKSCGLPDSADGALAFGQLVLKAADYRLAIVKPQSAYFERYGSAGIRALEELAAEARRKEVLVLLDVKRGDIDTTGEAYLEAFFGPQSTLRGDAVTLSAYLGLGALDKAIRYAVKNEGGVFVVVRSSNPEGQALQTARQADGLTVAESLCRGITALNRRFAGDEPGTMGPVGAVVGATCEDAAQVVAAMPGAFILAPGVGAQGATFADVERRMPAARGRVLPSVSRGVLANGSGVDEMRAAIRGMQEASRMLMPGN